MRHSFHDEAMPDDVPDSEAYGFDEDNYDYAMDTEYGISADEYDYQDGMTTAAADLIAAREQDMVEEDPAYWALYFEDMTYMEGN